MLDKLIAAIKAIDYSNPTKRTPYTGAQLRAIRRVKGVGPKPSSKTMIAVVQKGAGKAGFSTQAKETK